MKVPIIAVVGEFGSGKTAYATYTGIEFLKNNPTCNLFTNYPLKNLGELATRWKQFNFSDISEDVIPDRYSNGLMIIDEIQEGADAYDFMKSKNRNKSKFINQIRKNDLQLMLITPNLDFIDSRIRKVCNYFVIMDEMEIEGIITAWWYKKNPISSGFDTFKYPKPVVKDISTYFKYYDSKHIIRD